MRIKGHRAILALAVVGCAAVSACGGPPEPPSSPRPARARILCPPPVPVIDLGPGNTGVPVYNELDEPLLVFIERCDGHSRLGTVLPNRGRLFGLPSVVYLHGGDLVFHTFTLNPSQFYATYRHAPGSDTLRFDPVEGVAELRGAIGQAVTIEEGRGVTNLVMQDRQERVALTWTCSETGLQLVLHGLDASRGPYRVAARFGTQGDRSATNPWQSGQDGELIAPDALAGPLLRRMAAVEVAELEFSTADYVTVLTFDTVTLAEAAGALSCS